MAKKPELFILGTRGIPAAHGGFETFAEKFSLHMVRQGWSVTCYCQVDRLTGVQPHIDYWKGVRRVRFAAPDTAGGTMKFDLACVKHALGQKGVMLVLGYNTAVFSAWLRLTSNPVLTNMDGIEWKRAKWAWYGKLWFWFNEAVGALTSTKLIADHPEIARHLGRWRSQDDIVMIPYGADPVNGAPVDPLAEFALSSGNYVISIGRIEPENNILTMIEAYARKSRRLDFLCLGKLDPAKNAYHAAVVAAGKGRVKFPGGIYDPLKVKALRFHAAAYCHGHSVGGTNPSLVEALGAGNIVLAHDNPYNRWVAGRDQLYFNDSEQFSSHLDQLEAQSEEDRDAFRRASKHQFDKNFHWLPLLEAYEDLCCGSLGRQFEVEPRPIA